MTLPRPDSPTAARPLALRGARAGRGTAARRRRRSGRGVLALVLGAVAAGALAAPLATPPAAEARGPVSPTVLSVEPNDTAVDGWGGWLVWSRRGDDGRFGLVARTPDGVGVQLAVPPQAAPIDASIGPGPDGGPLIVYARCSRPAATPPTGCDVHRLDPRTGADAPVPSASVPGVDERAPSVWGDRIAFSRSVGRPAAGRSGVAITTLDATAPPEATVFGPRTERVGSRTRAVRTYAPDSLDLRGSSLAYVWHANDRWRLLVRPAVGRERVLVTATSTRNTLRRLGRPALSDTEVVVPRLRTGRRSRSELYRSTLTGGAAWTLESGFSSAQTGTYGSAITAVASPTPTTMVLVRRLASDGRWSCKNAAVAAARGCEILQVDPAQQPWRRVATGG